jgi:hypothetical protein
VTDDELAAARGVLMSAGLLPGMTLVTADIYRAASKVASALEDARRAGLDESFRACPDCDEKFRAELLTVGGYCVTCGDTGRVNKADYIREELLAERRAHALTRRLAHHNTEKLARAEDLSTNIMRHCNEAAECPFCGIDDGEHEPGYFCHQLDELLNGVSGEAGGAKVDQDRKRSADLSPEAVADKEEWFGAGGVLGDERK